MMCNIKDIIFQQYIETNTSKFASYKTAKKAMTMEDELSSQLTKSQNELFEKMLQTYSDYHAQREEELVEYIFDVLTSTLKK